MGPVKTQNQLRDGRRDCQGQKRRGLEAKKSEEPSTTDGEAEVQRGEGLDQDPWPDPLLPEPFLASLSAFQKTAKFHNK